MKWPANRWPTNMYYITYPMIPFASLTIVARVAVLSTKPPRATGTLLHLWGPCIFCQSVRVSKLTGSTHLRWQLTPARRWTYHGGNPYPLRRLMPQPIAHEPPFRTKFRMIPSPKWVHTTPTISSTVTCGWNRGTQVDYL